VRTRSRIAIACALTLTVAVQVAYAAPSRATGELRAARCCATRCQHQTSAGAATARCCGVERAAADLATFSPSANLHTTFVADVSYASPGRGLQGASVQTLPADLVPRASPIFLLTASLRL